MPDAASCIDGVLMPLSQARIAVDDPGLVRGDGVFEVIRLYDGRPYALERHLRRLEGSAAGLRLPIDIEALARDVETILREAAATDALLRLMVTRGGRRIAILEALPEHRASLSLGYVTYAPPRVLDGVKSLSYAANMLASRLARERGFEEALLVTPHGRVLECPTASFFAVRDGAIVTPPLSEHILDSITRALVIELADVDEQPIATSEIAGFDEAFVASSVLEIMPVARIEDATLPAPGPLTSELASAVRARIAAETAG
jgi:branched-chain amino acid aminotransferase